MQGALPLDPTKGRRAFGILGDGSRGNAPCPSSGLVIHGERDESVPLVSVDKLVQKLRHQREIVIDYRIVPGADHAFRNHMDELRGHVDDYLDTALRQDSMRAAGG